MFSSEAWLANPSSGFYNGVATQSLRFNDGDSAHLSFTPSSANGQTKCTISAWVKRATLGSEQNIFHAGTASGNRGALRFLSNDTLEWAYYNGSWILDVNTSAVYRDTTNWYHIVARLDTTDGTADIYVNGSIQTLQTSVKPSSSQNTSFGQNVEDQIGERGFDTTGYFDGYLSQVNFINGTDLTASSFAETKEGVWIPKNTSGLTFGTNGFQLEFKQTGTGTASASTIGADTSGNTNHLTSTNLVASDSNMPDCPENNFSTWNSLFRGGEKSSSITASSTLSEGNLQVSVPTNSYMGNTFRPTKGKWYCEIYLKTRGSVNGEIDYGWLQATTYSGATAHAGVANKWGAYYHGYSTARYVLYDEASQLGSDITYEIVQGDVLQLAWDIDNAKGWIGVNNTWYRTDASDGNPSAGTNEAFSWTADEAQNLQVYVANGTSTDVFVANFGQDSTFAGSISASGNTDAKGYHFKYTPPTSFLALCSANLPEPTISPNADTQADDHFDTLLYTGNNQSAQDIGGLGFKPDWVIIKGRSYTDWGAHFDSSRGTGKVLQAFRNYEEGDYANTLDEFRSDGFGVGADSTAQVNYQTNTYVAWCWKANGGTTTTNDASATGVGTIDSVYQANTTAGFSIITYTGTGSEGTLAHGLNSAPEVVIIKNRTDGREYVVGHTDNTFNGQQYLSTNGEYSANDGSFGSTAPTPTVVNVNSDQTTNESGDSMVMYCFHSVDGYSKFGSYASNNSSDGVFVHLGFRPAWLIIKLASASGENWHIFDNKRATYNVVKARLIADGNSQENTNDEIIDFLSNGFKLRDNNDGYNGSSKTYIYMAFAEMPQKYSLAR